MTPLSLLVALAMAAASALGLAVDGLYRDNLLVASGWRGNDLVTLAVAAPLLAATTLRRGSPRARLVQLGLLDYALYNYGFYLFGAAFNPAFLLYVFIFSASGFALVGGLATLDVDDLAAAGRRPVAAWMALVALFLGGFWTVTSVAALASGEPPPMVAATGHPTNVVAALDLSMVAPLNALAAVWLWRRRPWGVALAVVANVKGAVYMPALAAATVAATRAGATDALWQAGLWGAIGAGCGVALWSLLRR